MVIWILCCICIYILEEDDDEDAIEVLGSDSEAELLQETSEISHDPDASQGDDIREGDLADESSQGDSVVDKPDTSQKSKVNKPDSGDLGNGVSDTDKVMTENDDCVLALDNVSQNDDSVLDNDENDSDLLKEDDDEEETKIEKKKKETSKKNVSDGQNKKTEDGVD